MRHFILFLLCISVLFNNTANAQTIQKDSISYDDCKFKVTDLIAPTVLITAGSFGIKGQRYKNFNQKVREKLSYKYHNTKRHMLTTIYNICRLLRFTV